MASIQNLHHSFTGDGWLPAPTCSSSRSDVHSSAHSVEPSKSRRRRHGFTLIEMLLVVSIIIVLIALLLPALRQSKNNSDRVICATRQRMINNAMTGYTSSEAGYYPTATHASGYFADAYELRRGHPYSGATDRPALGLGLLVTTGYLPTSLGKVIHCPSFDNSNYHIAATHCMDMQTPWGYGGSGYSEFPNHRIIGSYTYRGTSFQGVNGRPPRSKNAADNFVTLIDVADLRFRGEQSVNNAHGGYNRAFGDGSVSFLADENHHIDYLIQAGGSITMNGRHKKFNDELIYGYMGDEP